jgi:uncharacterized protein (TIGR00251 family)
MEKDALLDITVIPKSSRSDIIIDEHDIIKIYLNSPPSEGKANRELIDKLSKKIKIPKSGISIIKGEKGRKKRVLIRGLTKEEILDILEKS